MDQDQQKDFGERVVDGAKDFGHKVSSGARSLKQKIVDKLSEDNEATPEQRLKNIEAELNAAKIKQRQVERQLLECQDEAEKYKRYIEKAEAAGDNAKVRRFTDNLEKIAARVPDLSEDLQEAKEIVEAIEEIMLTAEAQPETTV